MTSSCDACARASMDSKSKYVEMDTISPTSVPNYSSDDGEELVPVDNSYASYEAPVPQPRNSNVARKQLTEIPSAASPKKTALCLTLSLNCLCARGIGRLRSRNLLHHKDARHHCCSRQDNAFGQHFGRSLRRIHLRLCLRRILFQPQQVQQPGRLSVVFKRQDIEHAVDQRQV